MTEQEFYMYWEAIAAIARMASVIPAEKVKELIRGTNIAHTVGPVLDPTAYRAGAHNLDDQKMLAQGFLTFREAIDKLVVILPPTALEEDL